MPELDNFPKDKVNEIKTALRGLSKDAQKLVVRDLTDAQRKIIIDVLLTSHKFVPTRDNILAEVNRFEEQKSEFIAAIGKYNISLASEVRDEIRNKGVDFAKLEDCRSIIIQQYKECLEVGKEEIASQFKDKFGDAIDFSKSEPESLPAFEISAEKSRENDPIEITQEIDESELEEMDDSHSDTTDSNKEKTPPPPTPSDEKPEEPDSLEDEYNEDDQLDVDTIVGEGEDEVIHPLNTDDMEEVERDTGLISAGPILPLISEQDIEPVDDEPNNNSNSDTDDSIIPVNTEDMEEMQVNEESDNDDIDELEEIEPADEPEEDAFESFENEDGDRMLALMDELRVHDAFDMWQQSGGDLDDVLFLRCNAHTVRTFFRMSLEMEMFEDAMKIFKGKDHEIDLSVDIDMVALQYIYFDDEEKLKKLKEVFAGIHDFKHILTKQQISEINDAVKNLHDRVQSLEQLRDEQREENQEVVEENTELSEQISQLRSEIEVFENRLLKAYERHSELQSLVDEKGDECNSYSLELVSTRHKLESADARIQELQKLLEGEQNVNSMSNTRIMSLEGALATEQEYREKADQRNAELSESLSELTKESRKKIEELTASNQVLSQEIDDLHEQLRLVKQKSEVDRVELVSQQIENTSLRGKIVEHESAVFDMNAKQIELDHALQRITELKTDLSQERSNNDHLLARMESVEALSRRTEEVKDMQVQDVKGVNDTLARELISLKSNNSELRAEVTRLSETEQILKQANQRISVLEGQLEEVREMNKGLRSQLVTAYRQRSAEPSLSKPEEVSSPVVDESLSPEKLEEYANIDDFLDRIRFGATINAVKFYSKNLSHLSYGDIEGFEEAVKEGYAKIMRSGDESKARKFKEEFGSGLDLN